MKTVLVLDDESVLLKLLGAVLKRRYNIIEATTADQALCLFKAHGRQVDLLIADLSLSKSSGIQVALILRSEIPLLPVILTSGYPGKRWECSGFSRSGTAQLHVGGDHPKAVSVSNAFEDGS